MTWINERACRAQVSQTIPCTGYHSQHQLIPPGANAQMYAEQNKSYGKVMAVFEN